MKVAFHIGAIGTEENGIRSCLATNRDRLAGLGIELSPNRLNEAILNEALRALGGGVASAEMEEVVLEALVEGEATTRLVVSRSSLMGPPRRAFQPEGVFFGCGPKLKALANVLPSCECEFFLGIRNPATLLTELAQRISQAIEMPPAEELRWAPTLHEIVAELGGRRLVVWCNEDAPFVLPEAIRAIAGLPPEAELEGDNPVLERILTKTGLRRLAGRLERVAPGEVAERRRNLAGVLARHHQPEAITTRIELFGWDQATVDYITASYDEDVAEIAALPGVEFLAP